MQTALKRTVTVQKGGMIQVCSPELPDGAEAEVIILLKSEIDVSETWSEEDLRDFSRSSEAHILSRLEEAENA